MFCCHYTCVDFFTIKWMTMQDESSNVPEFVQLDPFSAGARPHGFGTPWIKCLKGSFLVEEMQFMDVWKERLSWLESVLCLWYYSVTKDREKKVEEGDYWLCNWSIQFSNHSQKKKVKSPWQYPNTIHSWQNNGQSRTWYGTYMFLHGQESTENRSEHPWSRM
jgi:hypothetical protein